MVVSFSDFTPPRRYDNLPWTNVLIEEAAASTGPWTAIATQAIAPLDADPSEPRPRNFTTEAATLEQGWYRVVFIDANGDRSLPSDAIQHLPSVASDVRPTMGDVALLLRARTVVNGNELGVFTTDTRPTASDVEVLIDRATEEVVSRLAVIPENRISQVRWIITLLAAALIELSYTPEQTNDTGSAYSALMARYDEALAAFRVPRTVTLA